MAVRKGALVVLSGGQDSTTCLFWAMKNFDGQVRAVTFDYGQRHSIEIEAAKKVAALAGLSGDEHEVIAVGDILRSTSPLVDKNGEVESYDGPESLPGGIEKTFVPMRNALFLTIAANRLAYWKLGCLVTGVSQEDYGGYPDCRLEFINSLSLALGHGLDGDPMSCQILTPLLHLNKAQTVKLAEDLGCLPALEFSHTCYNGTRPPCLRCHACLLRAKGFRDAGVDDPLVVSCREEGLLPGDTPGHGLRPVSGSAG